MQQQGNDVAAQVPLSRGGKKPLKHKGTTDNTKLFEDLTSALNKVTVALKVANQKRKVPVKKKKPLPKSPPDQDQNLQQTLGQGLGLLLAKLLT